MPNSIPDASAQAATVPDFRYRLILTLILVVFSATARVGDPYMPVFVALIAALLARIWRCRPSEVARRFAPALFPILAVLVVMPLFPRTAGSTPSAVWGPMHWYDASFEEARAVAIRIGAAVAALAVFGAATPAYRAVEALDALHVPEVFVAGISQALRSIAMLGDESARMQRALRARGYRARTWRDIRPLARLAAALFIRAHERGERVYDAMLARGYAGRFPVRSTRRWSAGEWARLAGLVATLSIVRWRP